MSKSWTWKNVRLQTIIRVKYKHQLRNRSGISSEGTVRLLFVDMYRVHLKLFRTTGLFIEFEEPTFIQALEMVELEAVVEKFPIPYFTFTRVFTADTS